MRVPSQWGLGQPAQAEAHWPKHNGPVRAPRARGHTWTAAVPPKAGLGSLCAAAAFPLPPPAPHRRRAPSSECPGISWSIISRKCACLSRAARVAALWPRGVKAARSPSLQPPWGTGCLFWLLSPHDSFARARLSSPLFSLLLLPWAWRAGQGCSRGPDVPRDDAGASIFSLGRDLFLFLCQPLPAQGV